MRAPRAGRFRAKKIYNENPLEAARKRLKMPGLKRLHIVDLDGAKNGKSDESESAGNDCAETRI
jgi:phosphoribosylformimino-5-aminoimidazole carboxamide ribonucleotide (ProFAR) isomerase